MLHLFRSVNARHTQRLRRWRRPVWIVTACAVFILSLGAYRVSSASDTPQAASAPSLDPKLKEPYIDVDEWRDKPVRHRMSMVVSRAPRPASLFTSRRKNSTKADSFNT